MTSPNRRQLLTGGAGLAGVAALTLGATPASASPTAYATSTNDPNRKVTPGADVAAGP